MQPSIILYTLSQKCNTTIITTLLLVLLLLLGLFVQFNCKVKFIKGCCNCTDNDEEEDDEEEEVKVRSACLLNGP